MKSKTVQGSRERLGVSNRGGKVLSVALLFVGGLALFAALLWWNGSRRGTDSSTRAEGAAAPHQAHEPSAVLEDTSPSRDAPLVDAEAPPPTYPTQSKGVDRYRGIARLEVYLVVAEGSAPPKSWTLSLEPSKVLVGSAHARSRRVEASEGQTKLVLDDVALGGYEVRALADGYDGPSEQLELFKPDEVDVIIHLRLYERGFLTGRVQDATGGAVENIEVIAQALQGGAQRATRTDRNGHYRFDALPDGDYRVYVGASATPLASFDDISYVAPSLHMPALVVPTLGDLTLRVVGTDGQGIPGATIEGLGLKSGPFTVVTDDIGSAVARHCAQGELSVFVNGPNGERGSAKMRFDPNQPEELTVRIVP